MSDWSEAEHDRCYRLGKAGQAFPWGSSLPNGAEASYERGVAMRKEALTVGKGIPCPAGALPSEVSDGYHSFKDLYDHRIGNFLAVMSMAAKLGLDSGWSRNHDDGLPCFGGGWVIAWVTAPSGLQARYHMEDTRQLPAAMERPLGAPWNGKEQTLAALREIASG